MRLWECGWTRSKHNSTFLHVISTQTNISQQIGIVLIPMTASNRRKTDRPPDHFQTNRCYHPSLPL